MDILSLPTKYKNRRLSKGERQLLLTAALAEVDAQIAHANLAYTGWTTQPFTDERVDQLRAWSLESSRLNAHRARILAEHHKREFFLAIQH